MAKTDLPDLPKRSNNSILVRSNIVRLIERHTAECVMKVARDRGDRVYDNGHYFIVED